MSSSSFRPRSNHKGLQSVSTISTKASVISAVFINFFLIFFVACLCSYHSEPSNYNQLLEFLITIISLALVLMCSFCRF